MVISACHLLIAGFLAECSAIAVAAVGGAGSRCDHQKSPVTNRLSFLYSTIDVLRYADPFMSRTPRHIFLPALLAATLAATAAAQPAKPIANWANLNQLVTGAEIRVTLANGKTLRGFMQRVTPESLAINATTSQETLPRQDIRRVDQKRPGHRGRNTLIGLAVGTGVGLAAGAVADSKSGRYDMFPNGGKVVLTPVGAIIGTVVGVALPTGGWREVYRAP